MATGYLDRTLSGSYAKKVLDDDRWPVNRLTKSVLSAKPTGGTKQAVNLRPLVSESDGMSAKGYVNMQANRISRPTMADAFWLAFFVQYSISYA